MPPKVNAKTPLDKRLSANAGKEEMSNWNIAELKQNLQCGGGSTDYPGERKGHDVGGARAEAFGTSSSSCWRDRG
eukprot:750443-Hanusia_phi.AAC.7